MVEQLSRVSEKSNGLLFAARITAKDADTMNDLLEAARSLADCLNALLGLSAAQGPGLKECDDALHKIEVCSTFVLSRISCSINFTVIVTVLHMYVLVRWRLPGWTIPIRLSVTFPTLTALMLWWRNH